MVTDRLTPLNQTAPTGLGLRLWLVLLYLLVTRVGHLKAAELGVPIGDIPLFLTDLTLLTLLVLTTMRSPNWLSRWGWRRPRNRVLFFLVGSILIMATGHFMVALRQFGLLAARDLAVFSYIVFLPLTIVTLRHAQRAERLFRLFLYCGVALAAVMLLDHALGGITGLYDESSRQVGVANVLGKGGGDVGGMLAFSMAGLVAMALVSKQRRLMHLVGVGLCLVALSLAQTRAAFAGLAVATLYVLLVCRRSARVVVAAAAIACAGAVLLSDIGDMLPLSESIMHLRYALLSATTPSEDANASWRMVRWATTVTIWQESPVVGVGFARPIIDTALLETSEIEGGGFNEGMPHNTFLTILARTGLFGLTLVLSLHAVIAWRVHRQMTRAVRRGQPLSPERFAVGCVLFVMLGYAVFVLFFERPMHNATYWIVLAIAAVLGDPSSETAALPEAREAVRTAPMSDEPVGEPDVLAPGH